jgi:hypothetical protein
MPEELLSTPDKTTMETEMVLNAPKKETITHTGTHPPGKILPSSPTTLNGVTSTRQNPKTSRPRDIAKIAILQESKSKPITLPLALKPLDTNGLNKPHGESTHQIASKLHGPEKTTWDTELKPLDTTTTTTGLSHLPTMKLALTMEIATVFSELDITFLPLNKDIPICPTQLVDSLTGPTMEIWPQLPKTCGFLDLLTLPSFWPLIPLNTEEPSKTDLTSSTLQRDPMELLELQDCST